MFNCWINKSTYSNFGKVLEKLKKCALSKFSARLSFSKKCRFMRSWFSGRTTVSKTVGVGSIPADFAHGDLSRVAKGADCKSAGQRPSKVRVLQSPLYNENDFQ